MNDPVREPLALAFANSAGYFALEDRTETITSFEDLVEWARAAGLVSAYESRRLRSRASAGDFDPAAMLKRALAFRDAIQSLLLRRARGRASSAADLSLVNDILAGALVHRTLAASANGYSWSWRREAAEDRLLWPIALSCAEILVAEDVRLKECSGRDCSRLFLDGSKNGSRRWCTMSGCGNRAKARRHYRRIKGKE